jgi:hypothetical protein
MSFARFGLNTCEGVGANPFDKVIPIDTKWVRRRLRELQAWDGARFSEALLPVRLLQDVEQGDWVGREAMMPLVATCTRFLSERCFPTSAARTNLLCNLMRLFESVSDATPLALKGGVAHRLRILEFCHDLPVDMRMSFVKYLMQHGAVGTSDMDFELLHDLTDQADVHRVIVFALVLLMWVKHSIVEKIHTWCDLSWTTKDGVGEDLRGRLQQTVNQLDAKHPLSGATIDIVVVGNVVRDPPKGYTTRTGSRQPTERADTVFFTKDGTSDGVRCNVHAHELLERIGITDVPKASCDSIYTTCNLYVGEKTDRKRSEYLRSVFHLARIKHTFVVYYTTRAGRRCCDRLNGELIDVSLADPSDQGHVFKRRCLTLPRDFDTLPIVGAPRDAYVRCLSVLGNLLDLQILLHRSNVPPPKTEKLEKRLVRYVMFIALTLLQPRREPLEARLHALDQFAAYTSDSARVRKTSLRTGVLLIDALAERERASEPTVAYLQVLHKHLRHVHTMLTMETSWNTRSMRRFFLWHESLLVRPVGQPKDLAFEGSLEGPDAYIATWAAMNTFTQSLCVELGGKVAYASGIMTRALFMSFLENMRSPVRHALACDMIKEGALVGQNYDDYPGVFRFHLEGVTVTPQGWRRRVFERMCELFDTISDTVAWLDRSAYHTTLQTLLKERVDDVQWGRHYTDLSDVFDGHDNASEHRNLRRVHTVSYPRADTTVHRFVIEYVTKVVVKKQSRALTTEVFHLDIPVVTRPDAYVSTTRKYALGSFRIDCVTPYSYAVRWVLRAPSLDATAATAAIKTGGVWFGIHICETVPPTEWKARRAALARATTWDFDLVLAAHGKESDVKLFCASTCLVLDAAVTSACIPLDGLVIDYISPQTVEETFY